MIEAWLSGTGAVHVAASYTSKSGSRPSRMHCIRRKIMM
ncbi:peptide-N4-asparagine amidase A [Streptomyces alboflavus]|uniref:Peptide-N4-asparagine amidase A n=1 Tax=Streptomyces alboflavus TaxID=67267 RepID=A0A1Z1WQL2_9ACTN|nr:peptide-N4-asparagine amidase A [Streptomyces alboflavus]